jgi:AcrR family transcriptional regulator
VLEWAIGGQTHSDIAEGVGVSLPTLYKYYREELDQGEDCMVEAVKGALFKSAMEGSNTAQIFILKVRAGWVERNKLEVSTKSDAQIDLSKLTQEELSQFESLYAKASLPSGS